jgi:hypothetical protein
MLFWSKVGSVTREEWMAISAKHTNVLKSTLIKLLNVWLVEMFLILFPYETLFTHFNE